MNKPKNEPSFWNLLGTASGKRRCASEQAATPASGTGANNRSSARRGGLVPAGD